jgi:hypothetical protein
MFASASEVQAFGPSAASLYLDGNRVAHQEGVSVGTPFTGRWQIGGGSVAGLVEPPTSSYIAATIDQFACATRARASTPVMDRATDDSTVTTVAGFLHLCPASRE